MYAVSRIYKLQCVIMGRENSKKEKRGKSGGLYEREIPSGANIIWITLSCSELQSIIFRMMTKGLGYITGANQDLKQVEGNEVHGGAFFCWDAADEHASPEALHIDLGDCLQDHVAHFHLDG